MTANYKTEQAETRKKLDPKLIYSGSPLYLGIKNAKRTMNKTDAASYKQQIWNKFKESIAEKSQPQS